jgi:hypothetical protein
MTAWISGFVGGIAAAWIGSRWLGLSAGQIARCLVATNLAGLLALLVTLKGERTSWVRRHLMTRQRWTWAVFLVVYFGTLIGVGAPLREGRVFLWLVLPLVLNAGFAIVAFGPLQDRIVAQRQRQARRSG